jgi:hypothetical protein
MFSGIVIIGLFVVLALAVLKSVHDTAPAATPQDEIVATK